MLVVQIIKGKGKVTNEKNQFGIALRLVSKRQELANQPPRWGNRGNGAFGADVCFRRASGEISITNLTSALLLGRIHLKVAERGPIGFG